MNTVIDKVSDISYMDAFTQWFTSWSLGSNYMQQQFLLEVVSLIAVSGQLRLAT